MNGGDQQEKNGQAAANSGEDVYPSILETFYLSFRLIFFSDRSLFRIFLDNRISLNLFTIYIIMLLIPSKSMVDVEPVSYGGRVLEGFVFTLIFISVLYLIMPNKSIRYITFLRLFLAIETIDVFGIVTFFIDGVLFKSFMAIIISWYLSLSVYIFSKITNLNYFISFFFVFTAFFIANLIPGLV